MLGRLGLRVPDNVACWGRLDWASGTASTNEETIVLVSFLREHRGVFFGVVEDGLLPTHRCQSLLRGSNLLRRRSIFTGMASIRILCRSTRLDSKQPDHSETGRLSN